VAWRNYIPISEYIKKKKRKKGRKEKDEGGRMKDEKEEGTTMVTTKNPASSGRLLPKDRKDSFRLLPSVSSVLSVP
jgi:hypothetical protein